MLSKEELKNYKIDPTIQLCFDYVFPISHDRVLATHGDEISLITESGDLICTYDSIEVPEYNHEDDTILDDDNHYFNEGRFIDKYLIFKEDGLLGVIDYDGDIVLDAQYKYIRFIDEDNVECF